MTCVIIAAVPTTEAKIVNETNERRDEDMSAWITVKAAAVILEVSEQWTRELADKKLIEAMRPGREWIINRASVLAYKAKQESQDTQ